MVTAGSAKLPPAVRRPRPASDHEDTCQSGPDSPEYTESSIDDVLAASGTGQRGHRLGDDRPRSEEDRRDGADELGE
jgi:hypothetical protein